MPRSCLVGAYCSSQHVAAAMANLKRTYLHLVQLHNGRTGGYGRVIVDIRDPSPSLQHRDLATRSRHCRRQFIFCTDLSAASRTTLWPAAALALRARTPILTERTVPCGEKSSLILALSWSYGKPVTNRFAPGGPRPSWTFFFSSFTSSGSHRDLCEETHSSARSKTCVRSPEKSRQTHSLRL